MGDLSGLGLGKSASLKGLALQMALAVTSQSLPQNKPRPHLASRDRSSDMSCPVCGKVFTHPYSLNRHKQKCEGTCNIVCTFCGYKTHRSDHYWLHMKRLHNLVRPKQQWFILFWILPPCPTSLNKILGWAAYWSCRWRVHPDACVIVTVHKGQNQNCTLSQVWSRFLFSTCISLW